MSVLPSCILTTLFVSQDICSVLWRPYSSAAVQQYSSTTASLLALQLHQTPQQRAKEKGGDRTTGRQGSGVARARPLLEASAGVEHRPDFAVCARRSADAPWLRRWTGVQGVVRPILAPRRPGCVCVAGLHLQAVGASDIRWSVRM